LSLSYTYDNENVFAKILRGEIPNDTVLETNYSLAFRDITPQAPEHILVIPKGPYVTFDHFAEEASDAEIAGVQEVPHLHVHILGGRRLGRMLQPAP